MNGIIENGIVKEILPCQYNGEQFEDYDRVNLTYGKLADVFSGKIMPTYYEALKNVSIPSYLNELAKKRNLNFSQILQEALLAELNRE